MININIKKTNFNMTPDIEEYINSKISSVEKFLPINNSDTQILIEVEIQKTTHHKKGDIFRVEFNLSHDGVLYRSEATSHDPRASIDIAKDQIEKQIRRRKTKRHALYEKGSRIIKKILRRSND